MFSALLLIGIWLSFSIGVETIGEMIEAAESCQIRKPLINKLLVIQQCFEIGEQLMWFILTLPIRLLAIIIDWFDRQTGDWIKSESELIKGLDHQNNSRN